MVQSGWRMSTARRSIQGWNACRRVRHLAAGDRHGRDPRQLDVAVEVVGRQRLLEPDDAVVGEHRRRVPGPVRAVRPELLAAAGVDHQLDVVADRLAGGPHQQLVELAVAAAERPPAQLDRLETPLDDALERPAQAARARRTGSTRTA